MKLHLKKYWLIELTLFILCGLILDVGACKYTVRDVAFAELDPLRYRLFILTDSSVSDEDQSQLEKATAIAFDESNVLPELVNLKNQPEHFVKKYVKDFNIEKYPVAILAYGKASSLIIDIPSGSKQTQKTLINEFEKIISSPFREKLINKSINSYGTVVILQGTDEKENELVHSMASSAVKRMINDMPHLPKQIKGEPTVSVLSRKSFDREQLFVWHIEGYSKDDKGAAVYINYGRGRQIGKILMGEEITSDRIYKMLSIIGADCECGLPRFWMQGKVFPYRFTEELREQMARSIGFDPENPLVKIEMKQMVGKSQGSGSKNLANKYIEFDDIDNVAGIGYTEIELNFDEPEDTDSTEQIEDQPTQIASVPTKKVTPEIQKNMTSTKQVKSQKNIPAPATSSSNRILILVIGALGAFLVLGGFTVLMVARLKA